MNQLNGKYVNVVLSVEMGRGMEFLKNDVYITGNFCNRMLESDKIPAVERPQFNTELVWEVEKKDLRKIRSANQPLRVECVTTDSQNRKERIGFALLSLRSAQVIPIKNCNQKVTIKWYKLIGCQADKKHCHPEIYLSLTVRDHLVNDTDTASSVDGMPYISEEDVSIGEEILSSPFPITYLNDGYIQVGVEESAVDTFYLNLLVEEVVNLDTLLPEILVFQQNKEKYYLSFKILGVTIKTKPFRNELHNSIVLNEKVVVKLLSDQDTLEEFFKTQNITINFCCGLDKLGTTTVELGNIVIMMESKCFFKYPSPNGIVPFGCTGKSPFISIQTWLERTSVQDLQNEKEDERPKAKMVFSNIPKLPSCCGDETSGSYILDKLEKVDVKAQSDTDQPTNEKVLEPFITKSVDTVIKNIPLSPRNSDPFGIYKKYILELSLKSIIWKKSPKDTKIVFKFLHPKASSYITILTEISDEMGELIKLDNLNIRYVYITTQDKAMNLLNAWPPRLTLTDDRENSLIEEYEFNVIFHNSCSAEKDATLKTVRSLEPLAKLNAVLTWSEFYLDEIDTDCNLILYPAVLDEFISVKAVSEIDKWKSKEKDNFEKELEKIKDIELKKLKHEWEQMKRNMEEQIIKSVNKCKKLQETLKLKVNSLKIEKSLIRKRNDNRSMYEEIFTDNWKKYCIGNSKEIIEMLSKAQRDNEHLKEIIIEQKQKLHTIENSSLTKIQTANLLQELRVLEEKFEDAQTVKKYFKEQWKRACDEIHELKREEIMNVKNQIQQNREQLSQFNLDRFAFNTLNEQENIISISARSESSRFFSNY